MSDLAWESVGQQAIAGAGVVYFLALLAHLVEWSALRKVPVESRASRRTRAALATDGGSTVAVLADADQDADPGDRIALFGRIGLLLTVLAAALHFVALVSRGLAADPNRVPWGNMYEFTLSGTFFVTAIYLVMYRRLKLSWLGPVVTGFVVALLMVAVIWLYAPVSPLREALNSPWLVIHVISAVIATGAFTLGAFVSVLYLVKERSRHPEAGYIARLPELVALDRTAYRLHAFAFPVWTFAVLITGPIWAHQAWSSYWNWDPKEVWAFITWVVYAGYLHARATAGWKGRKAAWLAVAGLATLWFNFIGINYFSTTSMHSYAAPAVHQVGHPAGVHQSVPKQVA